MVKIFEKTIKSPVRQNRQRNIKPAVMSDEKVIVQVIDKVGAPRESFTFHNDKGTNHRMI